VKQIRSILVASLLFGLTMAATAFDQGTIKGTHVNVRAQAKVTSEVVTQLNDGDRVTIIDEVKATQAGPGEPTRFYKIILPKTASAWVSAKYVKDGKVTASLLNVRAGAGENFSVLGRVNKATAITTIQTVGDWMEIQSPGGVHGFVATSLVKTDTPPPPAVVEAPDYSKPVPPVVPVVEEPVFTPPPAESLEVVSVDGNPVVTEPIAGTMPAPVEPAPAPTAVSDIPGGVYTETTVTATADQPPTPDVRPNELLTPPPAEPAAEAERAVYKVVEPSKKKTMLGRWWERVTTRQSREEAEPGAGQFHEPPPAPVEGPPAVRVVTREGIVVRAWNIQAPSDWALKEVYTGKIVNYLWDGDKGIPWQQLRGQAVIVTGEEAIDRRWKRTPVLHVETLKTINEDGDGEG